MIAEATRLNIDAYLRGYRVVACGLRNSRLRAKRLAILEMAFAQIDLGVLALKNGPLGDARGVASFLCPAESLGAFRGRLPRSGYFDRFWLLDFSPGARGRPSAVRSVNPLSWKGREFSAALLHAQDPGELGAEAPHAREFRLAGPGGGERAVFGYRGDGSELGRRALPAEDARLMAGLSMPGRNRRLLDPFAGAGGIVRAFSLAAPGASVASVDIDPAVRPGLEFYGSSHHVADSRLVSFPPGSFDCLATEAPFAESATGAVVGALANLSPCVRPGGVFAVMCGPGQIAAIRAGMARLGNRFLFGEGIDRKGTPAEVAAWLKGEELPPGMGGFLAALAEIR